MNLLMNKSFLKPQMIYGEESLSATVGRDLGLDSLATSADQLDVLATVHAEGIAPSHTSSEDKEAEAPEDSHAADSFSGNVAGVFSAGGAG